MRTTVTVDNPAAGCPAPTCPGRLEPHHFVIRLDEPAAGAVVLEGWAGVCTEPLCGFTVLLHPRKA